jgi:hypothetical protein
MKRKAVIPMFSEYPERAAKREVFLLGHIVEASFRR